MVNFQHKDTLNILLFFIDTIMFNEFYVLLKDLLSNSQEHSLKKMNPLLI